MKISCTPISARVAFESGKIDLAAYLELISEAGAEATDIMDINRYKWFLKDPEKELAALPELLEKNNLVISCYSAGNNFGWRDEDKFNENIKEVTNAIRKAGELGAKTVRIFGAYHRDIVPAADMDIAEGLQLVVKAINIVLPEAQKCGVQLALENHGRLPGHSAELLYIMKQFESPDLGICMDIANFYASNMCECEDAVQAYHVIKNYIKHVHFKDWKLPAPGSSVRFVPSICGKGCGVVPLRQIAYLLEADGYEGYCSLEYEAPELEGVAESLKYMRSIKESAELIYKSKLEK